jgi:hypothetical protein
LATPLTRAGLQNNNRVLLPRHALLRLHADTQKQQTILAHNDDRWIRVMQAVEEINRRQGRYTIRRVAVSSERGWEMRQQRLSPRYTTRLGEVLRVKAC